MEFGLYRVPPTPALPASLWTRCISVGGPLGHTHDLQTNRRAGTHTHTHTHTHTANNKIIHHLQPPTSVGARMSTATIVGSCFNTCPTNHALHPASVMFTTILPIWHLLSDASAHCPSHGQKDLKAAPTWAVVVANHVSISRVQHLIPCIGGSDAVPTQQWPPDSQDVKGCCTLVVMWW